MALKNEVLNEKYRPKTFDDLVFSNKEKLRRLLKENNSKFPHLLLFSKSGGTGKGSIFNVIKHTLKTDTKEINGSSVTGIDYIRQVVEGFVSTRSLIGGSRKLFFIDEADRLSPQAIDSLKSTMEKYQYNCIFVLSTNRIEKIPQPIRSRCLEIDLKQPNKEEILIRIQNICKLENINIEDKALKRLIALYYPDMRAMIKILDDLSSNELITFDMITYEDEAYDNVYQMLMNKDSLDKARIYWISENLDMVKLLNYFWKMFWKTYDEKDENNEIIVKLFAIVNDMMSRGNHDIQFSNFYNQIINFWHKKS